MLLPPTRQHTGEVLCIMSVGWGLSSSDSEAKCRESDYGGPETGVNRPRGGGLSWALTRQLTTSALARTGTNRRRNRRRSLLDCPLGPRNEAVPKLRRTDLPLQAVAIGHGLKVKGKTARKVRPSWAQRITIRSVPCCPSESRGPNVRGRAFGLSFCPTERNPSHPTGVADDRLCR